MRGISNSAYLLAVRRLQQVRSTRPWRRRLSRVDFRVWFEPSDAPDLISLYAALSKTEGAQGASPR